MQIKVEGVSDATVRSRDGSWAPPDRRAAIGIAHGVLGELWQGPVDETVAVVSLPTASFSRAVLSSSAESQNPASCLTPLRQAALVKFHERYPGARIPSGAWAFDSGLATGHGMASSTADIVAFLRCLADAAGVVLLEQDVIAILRRLERSDPVFRPSVSLYKTSEHVLIEDFGSDIAFHACYALSGSGVETRRVSEAELLAAYRQNARDYAESLARIRQGLRGRDLEVVAQEATRSALLAQNYLPNPVIDELGRDFRKLGAIGVARAHTGSIVMLLFAASLSIADKERLSRYFHARDLTARFEKVGSHDA